MKFNWVIATILLALSPLRVLSDETPRPIFASSIYNGSGILYIPTATPFANRACLFDNNSTIGSSVTTATELSYVHGATSNLQDQINAIAGGIAGPKTTNTVSINFTLPALVNDYLLNVNSNSGPLTVTLGSATGSVGFCADVKSIGTNSVSVVPPFGQTLDGSNSAVVLSQFDSIHACAVGTNWFIY